MAKHDVKQASRLRRKRRIRRKITGTTSRPRLTVFRSDKHVYAQVVDDSANQGSGHTLVFVSDLSSEIANDLTGKKKLEKATAVGKLVAAKCQEKGIEAVVFDRNGFLYHGRIKAIADAAREAGLKF